MKSPRLYIVTKDNDLLIREIESENESSITVKSRFYDDILITYDKSESVFKSEKDALRFQFEVKQEQLQKVS